MRVTRYNVPDDFLAHIETVLEQHEAVNNVILGLTNTLIRLPDRYKEFVLLTVDEVTAMKAAVLWTPPHNVNICADTPDRETMRLLAEYLREHFHDQGVTLPGVTGRVAAANAFTDAWTETTGVTWHVHLQMRVYELRQVIPVVGVAGEIQQGKAEHHALAAEWIYEFDHEAMHGSSTREDADQAASRYLEQGTLWLWYVDGEPVAMAANNRQTRHGAVIGSVYTPPDKRGHGYASALVATFSQNLLDSGKQFCALFTDLNFPTSNRIYQKIGYMPLDDFEEFKFEPTIG